MSEVPAKHEDSRQPQVGTGLESLVKTLRVLFLVLRITIIIIFVWLLFSGVFFVDDQEEAMLFHFGKLTTRVVDPTQGPTSVLTSGRWYWAWPYPIDTVERVPARKSMEVSTEGFFLPPENPNKAANERFIATKTLPPGVGGYLLTTDANIMHAKWTVSYTVSDARKYYLRFYHDPEVKAEDRDVREQRGMEAIIRDLLCNAVLAETARWPAEDVIRSSRSVGGESKAKMESLRSNVEGRLRKLVDKIDLGISVLQVNSSELGPPLVTAAAFEEALGANQEASQRVNEARAYEAKQRLEAEAEATRIEEEAIAYRTRVVESLQADRKYFEAILEEYRKNPETVLTTLYAETISEALARVKTKYVIHASDDENQELRIQIGPATPKRKNSTETAETN
jgi:membrane protease subunit HflK